MKDLLTDVGRVELERKKYSSYAGNEHMSLLQPVWEDFLFSIDVKTNTIPS